MIRETFLIYREKNDGAQLLVMPTKKSWLTAFHDLFAYCLLACLFLNIDETEQLQKKN